MKLVRYNKAEVTISISEIELTSLIFAIIETAAYLEDELQTRTGYYAYEYMALLESLKKIKFSNNGGKTQFYEACKTNKSINTELTLSIRELKMAVQCLVEILYGFEFDFESSIYLSEGKLEKILISIEDIVKQADKV